MSSHRDKVDFHGFQLAALSFIVNGDDSLRRSFSLVTVNFSNNELDIVDKPDLVNKLEIVKCLGVVDIIGDAKWVAISAPSENVVNILADNFIDSRMR